MNRREFFRKAAGGAAGIAVIGAAYKVQAVTNPEIEKLQLNVPLASTVPETENTLDIALEDAKAGEMVWIFTRSPNGDTNYRKMAFLEGINKGDIVYTCCPSI